MESTLFYVRIMSMLFFVARGLIVNYCMNK